MEWFSANFHQQNLTSQVHEKHRPQTFEYWLQLRFRFARENVFFLISNDSDSFEFDIPFDRDSHEESLALIGFLPWNFLLRLKNSSFYSTVTDFARFLGQSMLQPRKTAMWKDKSCMGMTVKTPWRQSTVFGISKVLSAKDFVSSSPSSQMTIGLPSRAVTCCRAFMHFWKKKKLFRLLKISFEFLGF